MPSGGERQEGDGTLGVAGCLRDQPSQKIAPHVCSPCLKLLWNSLIKRNSRICT